jgi:type II secretory pathway pseudopilin PulG
MVRRGASRHAETGRGGFTFVELLVIILIIAILLALGASAVLRFMGSQQVDTTRTELTTIQRQLDSQWQQVTRQAQTEGIPPAVESWIRANLAGADANADKRVRVIYIKLKQRQMFPMTFDEALNPAPLPPLQPYVSYLNAVGITKSDPSTAALEPAVCLLMALGRAPGGGGVQGEDLGPFAGDLGLPNNLTIRGLVDSWRQPLWFCRWPTDLPDMNPNGQPRAGTRNDPADPDGLLESPAWLNTPAAAAFQSLLHKVGPAGTSYRLAPVIASAGVDRTMGLDPRTFAASAGSGDNLYSITQP